MTDFLTESILHPGNQHELRVPSLNDVHFRILASISTKYNFLSSCRFDRALIQKLAQEISSIDLSRILRALASSVDVNFIFSNIDFIIDRFEYCIRENLLDDRDLYHSWKFLIDAVVQYLFRQLSEIPSAADCLLSILLRLSSEAFGDGSVLPPINFQIVEVSSEQLEKAEFGKQKESISKTGSQLLEEYWNSALDKADAKNDTTDLGLEGKPSTVSPRKRRRRRDAADVFEFPKRLRLMHQRDIIFVFHHTQAVVRPLESSKNFASSLGIGEKKVGCLDRKVDQLYARIVRNRKSVLSNRQRMLPLPVDVCWLVL